MNEESTATATALLLPEDNLQQPEDEAAEALQAYCEHVEGQLRLADGSAKATGQTVLPDVERHDPRREATQRRQSALRQARRLSIHNRVNLVD